MMFKIKFIMPHGNQISQNSWNTKEEVLKVIEILGFSKYDDNRWIETAGTGDPSFLEILEE